MRVSNVILRVSDMGEAVSFWRDRVGLALTWSGPEFAFFDLGGVQLALNRSESFESQRSDTELVLEVDDILACYRELKARGVPFEVEPRAVTSDGSRSLLATHFRDPDGHLASVTGWVSEDTHPDVA